MNAPTKQEIAALLNTATSDIHVFFDRVVVVAYKLPDGFIVTGEAATINEENFSLGKGLEICRENALNKLWAHETYRRNHDG